MSHSRSWTYFWSLKINVKRTRKEDMSILTYLSGHPVGEELQLFGPPRAEMAQGLSLLRKEDLPKNQRYLKVELSTWETLNSFPAHIQAEIMHFFLPAKDVIKRNPAAGKKLGRVNFRTSSHSKNALRQWWQPQRVLHNSDYEDVGHRQKHSQHLIKRILIKKYAKTIMEKIVKLVVKGYTCFPLTWIFMNKVPNKVKFKMKWKLVFILLCWAWFWGRNASRVYYCTILIKYKLLMALLYFSLKTSAHKGGNDRFSREVTTPGKTPTWSKQPVPTSKGQRWAFIIWPKPCG